MIPSGQIDNWFNYHPLKNDSQVRVYDNIRDRARGTAHYLNLCMPDGYEKTMALAKLRESIMWANAGVACGEEK